MTRVPLAACWIVCLGLGPAAAQTARPQTPIEPVPYRSEPVVVEVAANGENDPAHTLAGTLTLPDETAWGDGPHPGVVLISGSGPQDRDSTIMGHRPFLVLADHLTRRGIAVLRYDDRGVGESTGDFVSGTITRFARDASAAASALRAHPAVDDRRVGLIGHSEGGIVAPIVAVHDPGIAFVVLLAGPGVPGLEILLHQSESMYRSGGQPEAWIAEDTRLRQEVFDSVIAGVGEDDLRPLVRALVDHEMAYIQDESARERMAGQILGQFTGGWLREFCSTDPRVALRGVAVPVLALNGTLDTQVPADMNLPEIERALSQGQCPSATVVRLVGLNHLFQPATTGMIGEYPVIETTFDPNAMGLISGWVRAVAGGMKGGDARRHAPGS